MQCGRNVSTKKKRVITNQKESRQPHSKSLKFAPGKQTKNTYPQWHELVRPERHCFQASLSAQLLSRQQHKGHQIRIIPLLRLCPCLLSSPLNINALASSQPRWQTILCTVARHSQRFIVWQTVTLQISSHTNRRPLQPLFVRHTNDRLSGSCLQCMPSCSFNALNVCAPPQCFAWRNNFLSLRSMFHVFLHSMFQAVCSLCFEAYTHTLKPNSTWHSTLTPESGWCWNLSIDAVLRLQWHFSAIPKAQRHLEVADNGS